MAVCAGWSRRRCRRLASRLGWRPEFPLSTVMGHGALNLVDQRTVRPFGLFTLLRFIRQ
jgi:phosphatidylethanolamine/phosphatidyl-N-methylethanolamine N-methyltransferase